MKREQINDRVLNVAKYYIKNKSTVRSTAKALHISKSTVHLDLFQRLPYIDKKLYKKAVVVCESNIDERHIRGGESTRQRYNKLKGENYDKSFKK